MTGSVIGGWKTCPTPFKTESCLIGHGDDTLFDVIKSNHTIKFFDTVLECRGCMWKEAQVYIFHGERRYILTHYIVDGSFDISREYILNNEVMDTT